MPSYNQQSFLDFSNYRRSNELLYLSFRLTCIGSIFPIVATVILIWWIPRLCVACGLRAPKSRNFAPFLSAEAGAWTCWTFVQRRHSWQRWRTLLCFFTTVASGHGAGLLCDYLLSVDLSVYVVFVVGITSKVADPLFFMEPDFPVRPYDIG